VTLLHAAATAVLFGAGAFLLLQPQLMRDAAGIVLISSAANLFIMAAGLGRGRAPIHPLAGLPVSDPLVQAMTLTSVVIGAGVLALVLSLVYGVYATHDTIDQDDLVQAELRDEAAIEQEERAA
jgi:multicomponent Na+:H+ antiporter subunit C